MSDTKKLLDKFRETCLSSSDNAIALKLGVSRAAVSRWVNGKGHPSAALTEKMAIAIGEPPLDWMVRIEAERTHAAADKKAWVRRAQAFGAIAILATTPALPPSSIPMAAYCVKL